MNEQKEGNTTNLPEKDTTRANGEQRAQTYPAGRRRTQEEQNKVDDEKRKEAMRELVSSWMDRLQLISVITTFFASTEATMLSITTTEITGQQGIVQAGNAAFLGALVLHVSAAIVSFLASFFLVNYRVHEARKEEVEAEGNAFVETSIDIFEPVVDPTPPRPRNFSKGMANNRRIDPVVWSSNPHLVQVGPFQGKPPANILGRCHSLSIFLATVGFVLAVAGIGCFAWAKQTQSVSIFTIIVIAICVILGVGILVVPDIELDKLGGRRMARILLMRFPHRL